MVCQLEDLVLPDVTHDGYRLTAHGHPPRRQNQDGVLPVLKADGRKQSAVGSSPVAVSRKLSAVSVLDGLLFFAAAGKIGVAVLVEVVNQTFDGVGGGRCHAPRG